MTQVKLTKRLIEATVADKSDVFLWDTILPGFGVRIKQTGTRSYIVQYRHRVTGQSGRITIGRHGRMTLDEARREARKVLARVDQGGDPAEERRKHRKAPTLRDLANDYLERHAEPNKREKSVKEDRAMLHNYIIPKLGGKKVAAVKQRDVEGLLLSLQHVKTRSNRVRSLLSKMFNLAVQWGWRSGNPVMGTSKFSEEGRIRSLSDEEMGRLLTVLRKHEREQSAQVILLQLFTGARVGEVLTSKWCDFDLEERVWTKPSHHTKQKRTERFPLNEAAMDLLHARYGQRWEHGASTFDNKTYVFPGKVEGEPQTTVKKFWRKVLTEADIKDYRLHDNRHTFASHLYSSGIGLEHIGELLGHTSPMTTKRYSHLEQGAKRQASSAFSDKIKRLGG